MSENWGADHIPRAAGRVNLIEALSSAQHMPAEAIEEALRRPQAVADEVLRIATRAAAGEAIGERQQNMFFWGSHVLAQLRDHRLCGPLLAILKRADDKPLAIFGDVVDSTLPKLVISLFDGDADALEGVLADRNADELVRWSLFAAYSFLVVEGRIVRERARDFLIRFDDERLARAGDAAWAGWEEAIALLGFRELAPRRDAALADARLLRDEEDGGDGFSAMLTLAESEPENVTRFETQGIGYLDDVVAELEAALLSDEDAEPELPVQNPLRHVGRNDPCPCGSGQKYKKCCLGKEAA